MGEEQERLDKKRGRVKEQREILEDTKEYIARCGAEVQKVSRRWSLKFSGTRLGLVLRTRIPSFPNIRGLISGLA